MSRCLKIIGCVLLCLWVRVPPAEALPISGRVVDYAARPVAGAQVAVYEKHRVGNDDFGRLAGPIVQTERTGGFALDVDVTSQYDTFIMARKEGLALVWDGLSYGGNTLGRGHFLLVMERPAELSGVLVDQAGKPVAGAKVLAAPKTSYHSRLRQRPMVAPEEWLTTQTDADGKFRFDAFAADVSADLRVTAPGWGSTYEFSTHYLDGCGFEVGRADIRLVLPQEGKVRGRVLDGESGRPVGNVELMIQAKREEREDITNLYLAGRTVSDANGCFLFAGVPARKHTVEIFTPQGRTAEWAGFAEEVEVKAGAVTDNVTIKATKGGLIEIAVRRVDTGKPLAKIRASVNEIDRPFRVHGLTDENGRIGFRVPPGQHEVSVWGLEFLSWRAVDLVPVRAGETVRLEATLHPLDRIRGSVRQPEGTPAPGVLVGLHPFGDRVYTDQTGGFSAGIEEQRGLEGVWAIALDLARGRAAATQVTGKDKPVELVLEPALHVTGRAADAEGAPIPAARVDLCVATANCLSNLGTETLTDPNGRFHFIVVPPVTGVFDYRISLHATDYAPKTYQKAAITGTPGSTCDLGDLTLLRADTSIAGVVVDCDGMPAPRIPIFLNGRDRITQPEKTTATDEQGRFRITRICQGPIRLQANFDSSPGGSSSVSAEAGQQDIRITLPGHLSTYGSLLGRPLPSLAEIAASAPPEDTKDKAVVVCFFDMSQRPSRYCLNALAKQADDLKKKGVAALAIQAAPVGPETLDKWVKEQNLALPVTALKGDATKVRFSWGVQSLPWLILADARQVVRAEGFAVAELPEKLKLAIGE